MCGSDAAYGLLVELERTLTGARERLADLAQLAAGPPGLLAPEVLPPPDRACAPPLPPPLVLPPEVSAPPLVPATPSTASDQVGSPATV